MKGIILDRPNLFRLTDDLPDFAELPSGYARVRTRRVGICGTDWHAIAGRQPFFNYPRILGHELGVEVIEVNDPASPLKPGDACSVEPYLNCQECIACRRGRGNCCVKLQVLGVHVDGGLREQFILPARKLHPSDKLSLDQLALVETLAIGCHAVARAAPEAGERVLILGAGPIGLSVIPFVQAAGAEPIVADVSETRLAFCRSQMKVRQTIDANPDRGGDVLAALGAELPTCVIDATGNPHSMMSTFDRVAPGGRIVFVGLFPGDVTFNDPNFHRREITLMGSRNALPGDFVRIIGLIEDGVIDTTPWITHRTSAADFVAILPSWQKPEANVLKAMVEF
ncbi:MAG TPA: zinc-binding alcohol dehydrogenase family protein [Tepidisphaeraceae bacterium]|jgi:2-desacetyl-2-hydroxyethyl bacteriochlorophyllide A dehydrogenase